jgi:hypothetical protein
MNDNTILRIKVPAHLYESVKEQLSLTEAKKQNFGAGWSVVKEKKAPKEDVEKVEEIKDTEMEKKTRSLEELKDAKNKLDKKIKQMETLAEAPREGVYDDFAKWKASFPEETEFKQENNYMLAKDAKGKELGKWNPITKSGAHADDFQYDSLEEGAIDESAISALVDAAQNLTPDQIVLGLKQAFSSDAGVLATIASMVGAGAAVGKKLTQQSKEQGKDVMQMRQKGFKEAKEKKEEVNELFGLGGSKTTFKKGDQVKDEEQSYWYVKDTNINGDPKLYLLTAKGTQKPFRQDVKRAEMSLTKTSK